MNTDGYETTGPTDTDCAESQETNTANSAITEGGEPHSPFAAWRYGVGAKALALAGFAALLLIEGDPTTISGHTIMPTGWPTTVGH